ncbi:MAG: D-glycero-beta-D-manno-heptose 1-phosphate adenylyltransferase [Bacteroidales bacterium]|nr:D-glycero-beta-D-manno-heptose 1-phosphate adenylyltransferase [Bacteroidales bacterium]MCF8389202.1 D-glycero-beta-D-manno-heptose 1-phosphate adenylyltransferase [Bacteroidales bacterium]
MNARKKIASKIISASDFLALHSKEKIVFTNGCFDIIHKGHIEYLSRASDFGSKLIIGLNSDLSVRRLKGEGRPVQDEDSRALILASMEFVDYVILFQEDTPYELINLIQPDVLIKGGDYKPEEIVGYDLVTKKGGEVYCLNFVDGYSSTKIINKLKS